jgi:haloalkane dehalogenase
VSVVEHTIELASTPVHYRTAPAGSPTPVYLHGLPTSSADFTPLLERTGGVAPDLLGFGRSGKGGHLEYTIPALADFTERLIEHLQLDRVALVGHQWGALIALELASRSNTGVERLALVSPLPLVENHHWSRLGRALRSPLAGELIMGATTRSLLARRLRRGGPWSGDELDQVWGDFDQGTQRAILRLYRATAPDHLAGHEPLHIESLVILGERDPWIRPELTHQLTTALLPTATVRQIPGAGHWPWREYPDMVTDFLQA